MLETKVKKPLLEDDREVWLRYLLSCQRNVTKSREFHSHVLTAGRTVALFTHADLTDAAISRDAHDLLRLPPSGTVAF